MSSSDRTGIGSPTKMLILSAFIEAAPVFVRKGFG